TLKSNGFNGYVISYKGDNSNVIKSMQKATTIAPTSDPQSTNVKNIDVRISINRKKQLTDMYYKVTYNSKKEGTLTLHLYDINKGKKLTVPSSVTKNAKKLNFKLNKGGFIMKLGIIASGKIVHDFLSIADHIANLELASLSPTKRRHQIGLELQEKYNISKLYQDNTDLFNDANVDTVYVAVPNSLHFSIAKAALEAGKNVICEKPFVATTDE